MTGDLLSRIPIFEHLTPPDFEVLLTLWKPRSLNAGEVLFEKGDHGDSMFVIQEGTLEIVVPVDQSSEGVSINFLNEGEFVGELSLLDGLPRTATARAVKPTRLLEMHRKDFMELLMKRPAVAISMVGEIGKRLRSTNELVSSLASKNVNVEIEERFSFGDRMADKLAEFGGSWGFIISFFVFLLLWMILNSVQLFFAPFDVYPHIFLNLVLNCLAAVQAPIIMMSQNRAQKKDRLRADLDYQVNLKSELMLQQLHAKMDELRNDDLQILHSLKQEITTMRARIKDLEGVDGMGDDKND
jgi:CRP/FNR family cyclic AMP-dependent transcriptional regulator